MKLTTERLEQILGSKIDPAATHLAIHHKHVFAERIYRPVHNLEDLREILTLRQEIERLKSEQSEVAARAVLCRNSHEIQTTFTGVILR